MIRSLLGSKRAEGMSEESVAKLRRHIHAMFAFAQDAGLVTVNPADVRPRARAAARSCAARAAPSSAPRRSSASSTSAPAAGGCFFTVALDTGLRRGELIGLRWGDVDLLQRIIYVRRSIGPYDDPEPMLGEGEMLSTKTEAGQRLVPILDGAQRPWNSSAQAPPTPSDDAPVFATVERKPSRDGAMLHARPAPLPAHGLPRVSPLRRARRPARHVRLHDLRHTAITNAIGQGEDILLISAFAGHAKTSTTVDVYGHLMPDRVRRPLSGCTRCRQRIAKRHHQSSRRGGRQRSQLLGGRRRRERQVLSASAVLHSTTRSSLP